MANDAGRLDGPEEPVDILIVDDLPDKLLVLQTVLQDLGQNLVLARSGTEALREILKREFAVVLLDVHMPDIDGLETAGLIRKYKKSAHTPIIFITAHADEAQILQGYALGAVDYIFSPVIPEVLRGKVKVFVDLHRMQRRIREQAEERIARVQAEAARRAADENTRRFNFLARASHELSGSLDRGLNALRLLQLAVPEVAPLAVLLLVDAEEQSPAMVLRAIGSEPGGGTQVSAGCALPPALALALAQAMRGETALVLAADALGGAEAPSEWPSGLHGGLVLPLRIGGRCLGALALATAAAAGFEPRDMAMLEELAGRAAIAFENARLYSNLQQEIIERQQAEYELEEAARRKDEFLAMLSHELRNPLAPIRNAVEVMRRAASTEYALAAAREVIERQLNHLTRLVDELLDVARIARGKAALRMEPVELSAIVEHAVETTRPLIEARRHQIQLRLPPAPVWLSGDFTRLVQVAANLLNNAAKYTPDGGSIELAAEPAGDQLAVSVRDNGIGIDAELLPRVFDLFTQGKQPLDRGQGGLGIGLTLVRQLVEQHGGSIEARSGGPGKGAEFRILLPLASSARVERALPAAAAAAGRALRVLVVDDNQDAAETIAMVLDMEGHEVQLAIDGMQALERLHAFAPEVVLLDIGLPNISGYEIAQEVRSDPRLRDTLLIALTGYGRPEDVARTAAAGFHRHFVKPVEPQQILDAIAQLRRPLPA